MSFSSVIVSLFVRKTISESNFEKCEFMKEEMECLGFDLGYGWWKPAASKMQPLQDMQIRDDPKEDRHDVRRLFGRL